MQQEPRDLRSAVAAARKFDEIMRATAVNTHHPRIYAANEEIEDKPLPAKNSLEDNVQTMLGELTAIALRQTALERRLNSDDIRDFYMNRDNSPDRNRGRGGYNTLGRGRGRANYSNTYNYASDRIHKGYQGSEASRDCDQRDGPGAESQDWRKQQ